MVLTPIFWVIFSIMNLALLGLNFQQYIAFTDLECDYLNPYELSSLINSVVIPEYLLQGAFSILLIVTGKWILFLLSLPPAYYNLRKYMERQHLTDVTEIFSVLNAEKKVRMFKLGFYMFFFCLVLIRLALSVMHAVFTDLDDEALGWFGFN